MTALDNVAAPLTHAPLSDPYAGLHRSIAPHTAEDPTLPAHRLPDLPGQVAPSRTRPAPARAPRPWSGSTPRPPTRPSAPSSPAAEPRWAHRIADHRPYPDLGALLAAADEAAYDLTPADLAEALAGESLTTLPDGTYSAAHTALQRRARRIREPFRPRLRDLPGRHTPEEVLDQVLAAIRSRLTNDPDEERVLAAEELRAWQGQTDRLVRD